MTPGRSSPAEIDDPRAVNLLVGSIASQWEEWWDKQNQ